MWPVTLSSGRLFLLPKWPVRRKNAMNLPNDPIMLLSVVNLKLRDFYKDLDALCDDMDADKADLCAKLKAVGYEYDAQRNQFV
jgi:hypothetical protein